MNEKIREIELRSTVASTSINSSAALSFSEFNKELFATLIIKECARLADLPTSQPYTDYGMLIHKHFGIK